MFEIPHSFHAAKICQRNFYMYYKFNSASLVDAPYFFQTNLISYCIIYQKSLSLSKLYTSQAISPISVTLMGYLIKKKSFSDPALTNHKNKFIPFIEVSTKNKINLSTCVANVLFRLSSMLFFTKLI